MIEFMKDKVSFFIDPVTGSVLSADEAEKILDRKSGKWDCESGNYDTWYQKNRKDHGEAYDDGWRETATLMGINNPDPRLVLFS